MNLLDLYEQREPYQVAIDKLEQSRIDTLNDRMQELLSRAQGATPQVKAALKKEFDKIKSERDSYYKFREQTPDLTPEAKKKTSNKVDDVQNLAVQRYLTRVRRENPAAHSDLEAISKHEIEKEKRTQDNIDRLQKTQQATLSRVAQDDQLDQAQSQIIKDLETQITDLTQAVQGISSTTPPATTATVTAPTVTAPAVATGATAEPVPAAQEPTAVPTPVRSEPVSVPKKDKNVLRRVRSIQKRLEKRVDQYADKKSAETAQQIKDLKSKLDAETAKLSDQGKDAVQQPTAQVIDITDRLKSAGLDLPRTGTLGEQESPVIGAMAQQLSRQPTKDEIYARNMERFTQSYGKTRGTKLNYGGSANVPLPFSDMDALVTTITAFPPAQKKEIWYKLFTDPNYLQQFMDQYVEQRGLIEGDVIALAQQRQAPDQLKAYNLALEIMKAARDPKILPQKIDFMKQRLFHDYNTRIQKHPDGHYYITFQGKQIKLPDPSTFALEHGGGIGPKQRWQDLMPEGWSDKYGGVMRPPTPYSVYIKGKKWKDFATDDHARAVMNKLKAKFKADGRDPETVTIAPTDIPEDVLEGIRDTASAAAVITCLLAGGGLTGCATSPQQTTQQVLKTTRDIGATVQTAKKITRAGAEEEVRQEIRNLARAIGGGPEANTSNILRVWRKIKPAETPKTQEPVNEEQDTSAVESAILRRFMVDPELRKVLGQYGPDKVMQAAEEVAYNVGDVDEIGTSDVSAYVQQVLRILGAVA